MSSVSTAFKVHYNQKLETHPAILGERTMASGGIDAPVPFSGVARLRLMSSSCSVRVGFSKLEPQRQPAQICNYFYFDQIFL